MTSMGWEAGFKSNQVVGNIGLYYMCYRLCKQGWNVLPTSRNARGIDIVIYSQDGTRKHTIQAKSLTRRAPVPFGNTLNGLIGDYLMICRNIHTEPEIFIASTDQIRKKIHRDENNGRVSYWLELKKYEEFRDNWDAIGSGF